MDDDCGVPTRGQSAVVVPVPEAEPAVSRWRDGLDRSAAEGMPAHITVLFPFLPESQLTADVRIQLEAICAERDPIVVTLPTASRFPGVLYLDPVPSDGLRELTLAIAERWPEAPPYGGRHDDVVPHLTVAMADDTMLDAVQAEITSHLPIKTILEQARIYAFDGHRWQVRGALPSLGAPGQSS